MSCSLQALNPKVIPLNKLVQFRQKEEREARGHDFRVLRHRYADRLESQLANLKKHSDIAELQRQFKQEMVDDLKDLIEELGFTNKEIMFSKELIGTILLSATALMAVAAGRMPAVPTEFATATGVAVAVTGVLGARNKFFKSRRELLRKHPMAYLFEMAR